MLNDVMEINVPQPNPDPALPICVVASSDGYFEIAKTANDGSLITPGSEDDVSITSKPSYASLDLRTYNVNKFFYEGTAGLEKLYALTNNQGLWRLTLDPTNDNYMTWIRE